LVVRYETTLTSERYVTEQAWRAASLERCPLHPEGGCGLAGHGSYGRVRPVGVRVARFWGVVVGGSCSTDAQCATSADCFGGKCTPPKNWMAGVSCLP
jgi:hypothetical protein